MDAIICVGAVVPHFPEEDKKLRASKLTRRRGGNCANTLEVLEQLLHADQPPKLSPTSAAPSSIPLYLLSVLPDKHSDAVKFIKQSFQHVKLEPTSIFRKDSSEAASSYIIQNQKDATRTIVSYNGLAEMTLKDFIARVGMIQVLEEVQNGWYHFEGRIPEVTLKCVQWLRRASSQQRFKISVELEKPEREGMKEAATLADVVFYSKIWAQHHGFSSAKDFLETQLPVTQPNALLCCTWGSGGAAAAQKIEDGETQWVNVLAWSPDSSGPTSVVDSIGAGDTFIAGLIYSIALHGSNWSLQAKIAFANELAGRKVFQEGFHNLGVSHHKANARLGQIAD